jgi:hypothetical protein
MHMQIVVAPLFQTLLQTKFGNVNIIWANVDVKARFNLLCMDMSLAWTSSDKSEGLAHIFAYSK